ncbi:peptide-methionine (R)-S-oxide reductase MsrB [Agaribacterium sp. ZY112]|uniref:peptide-methionine (R)-S-oxide reductase MsrB n=1 Tax=Agaribacterium sp. ZY112 TaxID=3233574 RepID=UPI003526A790
MSEAKLKDDEYWRDKLDAHEFHICREKGTERPFSGRYVDTKTLGEYVCRCCSEPLFTSTAKYDSGSGWPSFYQALSSSAITEVLDRSHGMARTEICCARCHAHLGHVFTDGPQPTGLRYCVNSASLTLHESGGEE